MSRVAVGVVKCDSYSSSQVQAGVSRLIDLLGGFETFLTGSEKILVKPNMLSPNPPSKAVTTHPEIVGGIIQIVKPYVRQLVVGDGPGRGSIDDVARVTGLSEICMKADVPVVSFEEGSSVRYPEGKICKEFIIGLPVLQADALVNVAKLKTHGLTVYTGAIKNLYGCVSGREKAKMHLRYQEPAQFGLMLLDLVSMIKPRLSIIDAVVAMDGNGPSHGRPKPVGAILGSVDPVALDVVALELVGVDPMAVPYLRLAREFGFGETRLDEIDVVGDDIGSFHVEDFQLADSFHPGIFRAGKFLRHSSTAKPKIDPIKCTGCSACVRACPSQVIGVEERNAGNIAVIDYKGCISCFCCHEMCPQGAVRLEKGPLSYLAERIISMVTKR